MYKNNIISKRFTVHISDSHLDHKPSGAEIGMIKKQLADPQALKNVTAEELSQYLCEGYTVQPGVTPLSEESRSDGHTGTNDADFTRQSVFMLDIDNKREDAIPETPDDVQVMLGLYDLGAAFMYETFSSDAEHIRFRVVLLCDEEIENRAERDRILQGLLSLFPQADPACINADRIFFGTNRGLIDGYTNFSALCSKEALLVLAEENLGTAAALDPFKEVPDSCRSEIPVGTRNSTLSRHGLAVLKRYGAEDGSAYAAFLQMAEKCVPPLDTAELKTIWQSALKGYRDKVVTNPDYLPPGEYEALYNSSLAPSDYTDVGQANMFVKEYRDVVRYSKATDFLVYDGKVWKENEIRARGLVQELTERQLEEARERLTAAQKRESKAAENEEKEELQSANSTLQQAKKYRSFAIARRKSSAISATLSEVRPSLEIEVEMLDKDGYLLNTPGGTVDLRTGALLPHDPKDYCTKITAVAPDTRNAQLFTDFIDKITDGDRDLARYIQEVAGMCAVGQVLRENLIIAYGTGGNGKSTLFNLLQRVLGDYSGALSAETLTVNCRKNKSPEFAELRGKRLVIAAELEEGMRLDTAVVKKLCSTDRIYAEKKYKDPFSFSPSHTVILFTNHLPDVGTTDKGTWDRLTVIPFNAKLRGADGEIKNYAEYLFENCGGAVLSWIIEGANRFLANGGEIEAPACVEHAIEEYHADNDWLGEFLEACCEQEEGLKEKSSSLFKEYQNYCEISGMHYIRKRSAFKAALIAAGFTSSRARDGVYFHGLQVKNRFSSNGFLGRSA